MYLNPEPYIGLTGKTLSKRGGVILRASHLQIARPACIREHAEVEDRSSQYVACIYIYLYVYVYPLHTLPQKVL